MAIEIQLIVRCDRCAGFLMGDHQSVAVFRTHPEAHEAAMQAGWGQTPPADDHAKPGLICRACRYRAARQRSWIQENRVIEHVDVW